MGLLLVQCKLLVTWLLILRTYKLKQEMHCQDALDYLCFCSVFIVLHQQH